MSTQDDVLVSNNEEGVRRVKKGGYAYLAESTAVEFAVARDCDLTNIGGNLDSKGYGISTPTGRMRCAVCIQVKKGKVRGRSIASSPFPEEEAFFELPSFYQVVRSASFC